MSFNTVYCDLSIFLARFIVSVLVIMFGEESVHFSSMPSASEQMASLINYTVLVLYCRRKWCSDTVELYGLVRDESGR